MTVLQSNVDAEQSIALYFRGNPRKEKANSVTPSMCRIPWLAPKPTSDQSEILNIQRKAESSSYRIPGRAITFSDKNNIYVVDIALGYQQTGSYAVLRGVHIA